MEGEGEPGAPGRRKAVSSPGQNVRDYGLVSMTAIGRSRLRDDKCKCMCSTPVPGMYSAYSASNGVSM